ncbi:MAG: class I SAM-dependent methyltransferase [Promethearchaeota archaeon]
MESNLQNKETHKQAVSKAFGLIASFYDKWYDTPLGAYVLEVETAAIAAMLPRPLTGVALDIGVGTGLSLEPVIHRGLYTIGIDLSWRMLQVAHKKIRNQPKIDLVMADAEKLPFREGVAELVTGMTVLEFVPKPLQLLKEIYFCLRPGGHLILGVLSSSSLWAFERRIRNLVRQDVFSFARFPSPWQLTRMLRRASFSAVQYRGSVYASSITPTGLLPSFAALDEKWGTLWLTRSGGAFLAFHARKPISN